MVGNFDYLIVTAGEGAMGHFSDLPVADVREAFDSKFWGQYLTVRAAIPYLNDTSSITLPLVFMESVHHRGQLHLLHQISDRWIG